MILAIQEGLLPGPEPLAVARAAGFDGVEVRDARTTPLRAGVTSSCPDLAAIGFLADFEAFRASRFKASPDIGLLK